MDHHLQESVPSETAPWDRLGEEVVITGISGRLPESDTVKEFMDNLLAGKDLVTDDERRWKKGMSKPVLKNIFF